MESEAGRYKRNTIGLIESYHHPKHVMDMERTVSEISLTPGLQFRTGSLSHPPHLENLFAGLGEGAFLEAGAGQDLVNDPMGAISTGDFLMEPTPDEYFGAPTNTSFTTQDSFSQSFGQNAVALPSSIPGLSLGSDSLSTFESLDFTPASGDSQQHAFNVHYADSVSSMGTNSANLSEFNSPKVPFPSDNFARFPQFNPLIQFQRSNTSSPSLPQNSLASRRPIPIRSRNAGHLRPTHTCHTSRASGVSRRNSDARRPHKIALRNAELAAKPAQVASQFPANFEANFAAAAQSAEEGDYYDAWSIIIEEPSGVYDGNVFPENMAPYPPFTDYTLNQPHPNGVSFVTPDPFQDCEKWPMSNSGFFDMPKILDLHEVGEHSTSHATTRPNNPPIWPAQIPTGESSYLTVPQTTGRSRGRSDPLPFNPEAVLNSTPMKKSISSPLSTFLQASPQSVEEISIGTSAVSTSELTISALSFPSRSRGGRVGPMKTDNRVAARKTRNDRTMCIGCKTSKVACIMIPGTDTCERCSKITPDSKLMLVCSKAYFLEIVMGGTTNYISQCSINHVRKDLVRRRRLDLPPILDFQDLLPNIEALSRDYHIRVLQGTTSLYVLDLSACHTYLSKLLRSLSTPSHVFRCFIDSLNNMKNDTWMTCIADGESSADLLGLLVNWNNMPSRVTYKLVWKINGLERQLDPDDQDDQQIIYTAAQLSRIINRKLELAAYDQLQKILNRSSPVNIALLANLAHLLVTLRWRISWWNVLGSGASACSPCAKQREKEKFENRVQQLCRILYFYYCSMTRRLPAYEDRTALEGKVSSYADTQRDIWEEFPKWDSISGFEVWMKEGEVKLEEASVAEQLKKIGLS